MSNTGFYGVLPPAFNLSWSKVRIVRGRKAFFKILVDLANHLFDLALEKMVCTGDFHMIDDNALLGREALVELVDIRFGNNTVGCPMQQQA